jgi:AcrR family transcriptional regulator
MKTTTKPRRTPESSAPGRKPGPRAATAGLPTPASAGNGTAHEARGARRKRETHDRLLTAAFRLMAEKGMEGVAVNEITEAADVGFGSFYNHFDSKETIHAAVLDRVFEDFADSLEEVLAEVSDPAEVIAASIRHTLRRARRDPVWGRFLLREALSAQALSRGLGRRLLRDIQAGMEKGRFTSADSLMALIPVSGGVLVAISLELQLGGAETVPRDVFGDFKVTAEDFPERVATALLAALGLARTEARRIARLPLPEVHSGVRADRGR